MISAHEQVVQAVAAKLEDRNMSTAVSIFSSKASPAFRSLDIVEIIFRLNTRWGLFRQLFL